MRVELCDSLAHRWVLVSNAPKKSGESNLRGHTVNMQQDKTRRLWSSQSDGDSSHSITEVLPTRTVHGMARQLWGSSPVEDEWSWDINDHSLDASVSQIDFRVNIVPSTLSALIRIEPEQKPIRISFTHEAPHKVRDGNER